MYFISLSNQLKSNPQAAVFQADMRIVYDRNRFTLLANLDTGARENFISQRILSLCGLEAEAVELKKPKEFVLLHGSVKVDQKIIVTWSKSRVHNKSVAFYVAPVDVNFDLILDARFLSETTSSTSIN